MLSFVATRLNTVGLILLAIAIGEMVALASFLIVHRKTDAHKPVFWLSLCGWVSTITMITSCIAVVSMNLQSPALFAIVNIAEFFSGAFIVAILLKRLRAFFAENTLEFQAWAGVGVAMILFDFVVVVCSLASSPSFQRASLSSTGTDGLQFFDEKTLNQSIKEAAFTSLEALFSFGAVVTLARLTYHFKKTRHSAASGHAN
eukprot:jgi/Hompol1/7103/HPOL_004003-RA